MDTPASWTDGKPGHAVTPECGDGEHATQCRTVRVALRDGGDASMPHPASALPIDIRRDDPGRPEVAALLREHLESVARYSPPESIHALDIDGLRACDVTFWSAWRGAELVGCGALRELDPAHGEIKSMRTATAHLRQGVGSAMLAHILQEARRRGYRRVSLETGAMEAFAPARALYARFGFESCGPFADYVEDRNSMFMTLALDAR